MTDIYLWGWIAFCSLGALTSCYFAGFLLGQYRKQAMQRERDQALAVATESLHLAASLLERMTIPGPVKSEVEEIMDEMQGVVISIQGWPK